MRNIELDSSEMSGKQSQPSMVYPVCIGTHNMRRFQRAYMTYFSMEHSKLAGNSRALLLSHLLTGAKPLICGLFAGLGRPLVFLSDALELHNPILVVQSLTLAAVDWMEPIFDILNHPGLQVTVADPLSPEQILGRVAYDGRLSGVMKAGPGFHGVAQIFANPAAKAAVLEYIQHLDCRDAPKLLSQLSALSPVILCATHKAATPAYDFYLSCIPTWVNSLRVLLLHVEEDDQRVKLIRGVWLLIVLAYITQLRPVLDASLLSTHELPKFGSWDVLWAELREQETSTGRCRDLQLLRTLRSMQELGGCYDVGMKLNLQAAWKLLRTWERWTGLGISREESLNIRL